MLYSVCFRYKQKLTNNIHEYWENYCYLHNLLPQRVKIRHLYFLIVPTDFPYICSYYKIDHSPE